MWSPSISTSGSTIGTRPASWLSAAYRASACAFVQMQYSLGMSVADRDHGAPLREARAELAVLREPLAQAVEALGDRLAGCARRASFAPASTLMPG